MAEAVDRCRDSPAMKKFLPEIFGNSSAEKKGEQIIALVALKKKVAELEAQNNQLLEERATLKKVIVTLANGEIEGADINLKDFLE